MPGTVFLRQALEHDDELAGLRAAVRAAGLAAGMEAWSAVALATSVTEVAGALRGPGATCAGRVEGGALRFSVEAPQGGDAVPDPETWAARCPALRLLDGFVVEARSGGGARCALRVEVGGPVDADRLREAVARVGRVPTADELRRENLELAAALDASRELALVRRLVAEQDRAIAGLHGELERDFADRGRGLVVAADALVRLGHEFKAPLDSIRGLCDLLLAGDGGPLTAEQRRQVGYVRRSAEELARLVGDFLELARTRAGHARLRVEEIDLDELVAELRSVVAALPRPSGVDLVLEGPGDGSRIATDRDKLAQILRNLLSNALKYTRVGEVRLAVSVEAERVRFAVHDTGIGIPEDRLDAIFDSFTRLDAGRAPARGTGLGLAVVRQLAGVLGGTVRVRSEPGRGSTFELELPRRVPGAG